MQLSCFETKLLNLILKTHPKQLLGSLPLDIALPTWAEFSTLNVGVFIYTLQLCSLQQQPNLKLKTQPKQLLGSLPLAFMLPYNLIIEI